jgi:hypothetical protein
VLGQLYLAHCIQISSNPKSREEDSSIHPFHKQPSSVKVFISLISRGTLSILNSSMKSEIGCYACHCINDSWKARSRSHLANPNPVPRDCLYSKWALCQAFQARPFPPSSLNRSGRRCDDYLYWSTLRLVCVRVYLVINKPHCRKPCFFLRLYFLTLFLIIILLKLSKPLLLYLLLLT